MYRIEDSCRLTKGSRITNRTRTAKKNRTTNMQKLELVRLMKANFLFIRGKHTIVRSEKSRAEVWDNIAARLNQLGPPRQSSKAWQKRWNDMRSATNRKMLKIQNHPSKWGEECPNQLTVVDRMIWDTFEVKPDDYMRDLNMKLWREKKLISGRGITQQSTSYNDASCSSLMSTKQSDGTGWNQMKTQHHHTSSGCNISMSLGSKKNSTMENFNPTAYFSSAVSLSQPEQTYGAPQSLGIDFAGQLGPFVNSSTMIDENMTQMKHWASDNSIFELDNSSNPGHENLILQDIDTKLDYVQLQNDKIISMLQSTYSLL